jgi:hypothetical protein
MQLVEGSGAAGDIAFSVNVGKGKEGMLRDLAPPLVRCGLGQNAVGVAGEKVGEAAGALVGGEVEVGPRLRC